MNASAVWEVMRFELARSKSIGRIAVWIALIAFPIALVATLRLQVDTNIPERWGVALYLLIPEITCILGLLLWATPVMSTELEGQTWVYLATRRSGRSWVLVGKYLVAVAWTLSAALVAASGCALVLAGVPGVTKLWIALCGVSVLSCFAHAALFVLIGVCFYRRTMVAAVIYTLVVEFAMSFVPAVVNKLTINYRLRGILAEWLEWEEVRSLAEDVFGGEPISTHLTFLLTGTVVFFAAAWWRLRTTEFPTQQQGGI